MDDQNADRKRMAQMIPSRRFVLIALAFICASVMTVTFFGVVQTRMLEARARDIVDDMLTSIRLVRQLDDYVEEKHLLVDDHILASLPAEMAKIEARLRVPPAVEIFGAEVDGEYQLRISDNGAGMSTEEATRIFEPLYRSPRMQHLPGTGLGLSIVNRIIQASGGAISVESKLEEGSTFVVHLKLANRATG